MNHHESLARANGQQTGFSKKRKGEVQRFNSNRLRAKTTMTDDLTWLDAAYGQSLTCKSTHDDLLLVR